MVVQNIQLATHALLYEGTHYGDEPYIASKYTEESQHMLHARTSGKGGGGGKLC